MRVFRLINWHIINWHKTYPTFNPERIFLLLFLHCADSFRGNDICNADLNHYVAKPEFF